MAGVRINDVADLGALINDVRRQQAGKATVEILPLMCIAVDLKTSVQGRMVELIKARARSCAEALSR